MDDAINLPFSSNKVVFMKNGEIAEQGSHEDLIKKKVCISTRFKSINPFVFKS